MSEPPLTPYSHHPTYIGVDPGAGGAVAFYQPTAGAMGLLTVHDTPTHTIKVGGKNRKKVDLYFLASMIGQHRTLQSFAVVEEVNAMPSGDRKMGATSAFSFGFAAGAVQMALAAHRIPMERIAPAVWKRLLKVTADKDTCRQRASELFPRHVHLWNTKARADRAEAALLAYLASLLGRERYGQ